LRLRNLLLWMRAERVRLRRDQLPVRLRRR
jgi:hypothetical protein